MKYLLDTDHIAILQDQAGVESARLAARIDALPEDEFAFSIVSFHEQVLGGNNYIAQARNAAGGPARVQHVVQGPRNIRTGSSLAVRLDCPIVL